MPHKHRKQQKQKQAQLAAKYNKNRKLVQKSKSAENATNGTKATKVTKQTVYESKLKIKALRQIGFFKQILKINRSVFIVGLVVLAMAFLWQFSAKGSETYSSNDIYTVAFDHQPKINESDEVFKNNAVKITTKKIERNNQLIIRTGRTTTDVRGKIVNDLAKGAGVVSVEAFRVTPLTITQRYQSRFILTGLVLVVISAVYLLWRDRKQPAEGLKLFTTFYIITFIVSLGLAVFGVAASKIGIVSFNNEIFSFYIAAIFATISLEIYLLQHQQTRSRIYSILFTPIKQKN